VSAPLTRFTFTSVQPDGSEQTYVLIALGQLARAYTDDPISVGKALAQLNPRAYRVQARAAALWGAADPLAAAWWNAFPADACEGVPCIRST
jgi:hypothetical protein